MPSKARTSSSKIRSFFDFFVFSAYPTGCISTPDKAVILSEALRRTFAYRWLCRGLEIQLVGYAKTRKDRKVTGFQDDFRWSVGDAKIMS
jgi:hypothetical protein